ncbi:hypothetical protein F2Q70_00006157 [Brassica cretica]|uniref:Uncharacterized protein n=1 Tax=Brassica cretica TaxID=69181 RepID=A0A8S9IW48_BRACR|nr:hypothetical protein F2Q70_00006157 [Brassica cretica]
MIIEGVNGSRTRSIYYGIAVSSLGFIAATLVQVRSPPRSEQMTRWEDKNKVLDTFLLAGLFLFYAILVIRSLCVPIPTITYRKREATWSYVTVYIMVCMFLLSHKLHSVILCMFMIGMFPGGMAVKQLNWPVGDVYIQHVVFTYLLCCVSCYLGFQSHERPAFYILIGLATLSIVFNQILDKVLLPSTDFVHSPSRYRNLDV